MICGAPVDWTVRNASRELQVCGGHLAWAVNSLPGSQAIKQVGPSGYHYVISGCEFERRDEDDGA